MVGWVKFAASCPHELTLWQMTRTAENKTKQDIMQKLRMNSPITIELSPDRPNIFYGVLKSGSGSTMSATLANNVRHLRERYPKNNDLLKKVTSMFYKVRTMLSCSVFQFGYSLTYVHRCDECGIIYITLLDLLKEHFTCPPGTCTYC